MPDDYAVVIGISRYPVLGLPPPDLKGPENDADAIVQWLTEPAPAGGGLAPERIKLIRSKDCGAPPKPAPTSSELEEAFHWLDDIATGNQAAGKGRTVGRRLYLYVSGHGFSTSANQVCLITGDAREKSSKANVVPTAWLQWFEDAHYFRELVLWADCCMDRKVLAAPMGPPLEFLGASGPPAQRFIAFAASRPLKAVEKVIPADNDEVHGVFTWNLLRGLRGAAADATGRVTARSLADWLRQSQLGWLDPSEQVSREVSKEPEIVMLSDGLVLARGVSPLLLDVTLRFPASAVGKQARIWSGVPPQPGAPFQIQGGDTKLKLRPGLYLVDVSDAHLRQGFAVAKEGTIVDVNEVGAVPVPGAGLFKLVVSSEASTTIRLVDANFGQVESAAGRLETQLMCGLFQFRIQLGEQLVEKVILLDGDWSNDAAPATMPALPRISSPIPLSGTRTTHEYHEALTSDPRVDVTLGEGAELLVVARVATQQGSAPGAMPCKGVAVLDEAGKLLVNVLRQARTILDADKDAIGACRIRLEPGSYVLQYEMPDGARIAQSLVLPPNGWTLEAYVLVPTGKDERPSTSFLMRRVGAGWQRGEDLLFEKARMALADERPVLSDELAELLLDKFENPLAGILGGHLLLLEQEKRGNVPLEKLNVVVSHLRGLLGSEHPDVEALSLRCPNPELRRTTAIRAVPLFERSWRSLIDASQHNPDLVPAELWQRVHATLSLPPFLAWALDEEVQADYRKALGEALFRHELAALATPVEAGLEAFSVDAPMAEGAVAVVEKVARPHVSAARAAALGLPPAVLEGLFDEVRPHG